LGRCSFSVRYVIHYVIDNPVHEQEVEVRTLLLLIAITGSEILPLAAQAMQKNDAQTNSEASAQNQSYQTMPAPLIDMMAKS
jgi:hypothetical protein